MPIFCCKKPIFHTINYGIFSTINKLQTIFNTIIHNKLIINYKEKYKNNNKKKSVYNDSERINNTNKHTQLIILLLKLDIFFWRFFNGPR